MQPLNPLPETSGADFEIQNANGCFGFKPPFVSPRLLREGGGGIKKAALKATRFV